jgi:threonine synthase
MNSNLTTERPTFVTHLECAMMGDRYEADQLHNLSKAGKPLLVRYDLAGVKKALTKDALKERPDGLWKWRELLPVRKAENIVSLGEDATPLIALPKLAKKLGGGEIIVKDEGRLPTGSFKARGLVMAVSMAKALGVRHMAMPTNGNAGAALAAYASRCGIRTTIFCPEDTPEINLSEIALEGASVYRVNGLIDDCGKLVGQGKETDRLVRHVDLKEPYRIEGKKTMGLELAEQFGWDVPDVIFYPTGGGTGLIGMWKAFAELEAIGFIGSKRPRMVAVQAEGCARWCAPGRRATSTRRASRTRTPSRPASVCRRRSAISHSACSARVRRLRDRGVGRVDPGGGRRGRARGRFPDVPGRRRNLRGLQGRARRRAREANRARRAVQLRNGLEVSDAEGHGDARSHQADRFHEAVGGPHIVHAR